MDESGSHASGAEAQRLTLTVRINREPSGTVLTLLPDRMRFRYQGAVFDISYSDNVRTRSLSRSLIMQIQGRLPRAYKPLPGEAHPNVFKFTCKDEADRAALEGRFRNRNAISEASLHAYEAAPRDFATQLDDSSPKAFVVWVIFYLNVIAFLVSMYLHGHDGSLSPQDLIKVGADYAPFTLTGQWWRMLTEIFLHLDAWHLGINMLALIIAGRLVERIFGAVHFTCLYLFCGLASSAMGCIFHPNAAIVGASGAIFGVYGALLAFLFRMRTYLPAKVVFRISWASAIFVIFSLYSGSTTKEVDLAAHVGGLAAGMALGIAFARPLAPVQYRQGQFAKSLALGIAAGVAIFAGILGLEPVRDAHAFKAIEEFRSQESELQDRYNQIIEKGNAGSNQFAGYLYRFEMAGRLEKECKPRLDAALTAFAAESPRSPFMVQYLGLMQKRIGAWATAVASFIEYGKTGKHGSFEAGNAAMRSCNEVSYEIESLLETHREYGDL